MSDEVTKTEEDPRQSVQRHGGALTGAVVGGLVGSVLPGIGTVVGAGLGAWIGHLNDRRRYRLRNE